MDDAHMLRYAQQLKSGEKKLIECPCKYFLCEWHRGLSFPDDFSSCINEIQKWLKSKYFLKQFI